MTEKILVTGGAGYIGSHACYQLAAQGFEPVVFDNLSTGHREFVKWGPLEIGNLNDIGCLVRVMKNHRIAGVIHFAAKAYVGESVGDPLKYYTNNVQGTISLLHAMQLCDIDKIVFSSTCATYGIPPDVAKIDEKLDQRPINPYGFTKLTIERLLADLNKAGKIRYIALRYFNAAGACEFADIGERHEPETHLIPLAIRSHFDPDFTLDIFGDDFETPDGTAIRDYIHVDDLASAHVNALRLLEAGNKSDAYNLGTGVGTSVLEIVGALESYGLSPKYLMKGRRPGDPGYLVADNSKALLDLNWRPIRGLEKMISSAVNWYEAEH